MTSTCPMLITSSGRPFAWRIASTVVPKRTAIAFRVSPCCTTYVVCAGEGVGSAAERVGRAVGSAGSDVDGAAGGFRGGALAGHDRRAGRRGRLVGARRLPVGGTAEATGHRGRGRRHADQRDATSDHPTARAHAQGGLAHDGHATRVGIDHQARARHHRVRRRSRDIGRVGRMGGQEGEVPIALPMRLGQALLRLTGTVERLRGGQGVAGVVGVVAVDRRAVIGCQCQEGQIRSTGRG